MLVRPRHTGKNQFILGLSDNFSRDSPNNYTIEVSVEYIPFDIPLPELPDEGPSALPEEMEDGINPVMTLSKISVSHRFSVYFNIDMKIRSDYQNQFEIKIVSGYHGFAVQGEYQNATARRLGGIKDYHELEFYDHELETNDEYVRPNLKFTWNVTSH